MYLPSEPVFTRMRIAPAGLWIDRPGKGKADPVLVVKAPIPALEAIQAGATVHLNIADVLQDGRPFRCLAFVIEDDPMHPISAISCCRTRRDQQSLRLLLRQGVANLHLFDELERHVAWCTSHLGREKCEAASRKMESAPVPYAGRFIKRIDRALDQFTELLDACEPTVVSIPISVGSWQVTTIVGIGSGPFRLDDQGGDGLEQAAQQLVESLFLDNAYRSPEVRSGTGSRELTDSLLVFESAICLMETKALKVGASGGVLPSGRRSQRIAKDIRKGLRQLKGAIRQIRSNADLYSTRRALSGLARREDEPIRLPDRDGSILAIILVSDLECDLDWKAIARTMIEAGDDRTLFQVLDLTELRGLVGTAKSPLQFISNLVVRYARMQQEGTGLLRVRIWREQEQ